MLQSYALRSTGGAGGEKNIGQVFWLHPTRDCVRGFELNLPPITVERNELCTILGQKFQQGLLG